MALLISFTSILNATILVILVEPYPPFVTEEVGNISGPYIEAVQQMMGKEGVQITIKATPIRRALIVAEGAPDTCVLGLNYAAESAEVLLYLGRIAPIYVWAYARHDAKVEVHGLNDLKRYQVATVDIAEVRQLLDQSDIHYYTLQLNTSGLQMLQGQRFDILLSDIGPEVLGNKYSEIPIDKLFRVAKMERWFACNPNTDPKILSTLRSTLRNGLFSDSVQNIWVKYGMGDYFNQVRKEWSATNTP